VRPPPPVHHRRPGLRYGVRLLKAKAVEKFMALWT